MAVTSGSSSSFLYELANLQLLLRLLLLLLYRYCF
jgi:hypothetical protein